MKLGWSSGKKDFAFAITALSQEQSACGANRRYAISPSQRHEDVGSSEEPHAGKLHRPQSSKASLPTLSTRVHRS